jgi:hypothetical protein
MAKKTQRSNPICWEPFAGRSIEKGSTPICWEIPAVAGKKNIRASDLKEVNNLTVVIGAIVQRLIDL